MTLLVRILCPVLLSLGIWMATSEWREPSVKGLGETVRWFGFRGDKPGIADAVTGALASFFSEKVKLEEERRKELEYELEMAHLRMTPEYFVGQNIAMTAIVLLLGVIFGSVVWSGFYIFGAAAAVLVFRRQQDRTAKERRRIEAVIDSCMPEFASYICSYVRVDRDVSAMLGRYASKCSEPILREELEMTISDAASSGVESALIRFDARAHSPQLSSIVRALITLANGTYRLEHFEQLEAQFETKEKERLAKAASDIPSKLKPYNYAIYAAFALMLMTLFFTLFVRFAGQLL